MKAFKKVLTSITAAALALICAVSAYAAVYIVIDGYRYTPNSDGTVTFAGFSEDDGTQTVVEVPSSVSGKRVTCIDDNTFNGNETITEVILNSGLETIETNAFSGCTSLTSVTFPSTIASVGNGAFYNCQSLTQAVITENMTQIAPYCFNRCSSLTQVTIPENIEKIGEYAFYLAVGLTRVEIKGSDTVIADTAFDGCSDTLVIAGEKGSTAEQYALSKGFTFVDISAEQPTDPDPTNPDDRKGDANSDSVVNGEDVTHILKYCVKLIEDDAVDLDAADVNSDGTISVKDATALQRIIIADR